MRTRGRPLSYETPRPPTRRRWGWYAVVVPVCHVLASYAVGAMWLGVMVCRDRSLPDSQVTVYLLFSPLSVPYTGLLVTLGVLAGQRELWEPILYVIVPYVAAFAPVFWWLARWGRRKWEMRNDE